MKLQTEIKPRRDGTVKVSGLDGKSYTFQPDEAGDLVCNVEHEQTVAWLLSTQNFFPADAADFGRALGLTGGGAGQPLQVQQVKLGADLDDDGDDAGGGHDDLSDRPAPLPIEAGTPPSSKKPKKAS